MGGVEITIVFQRNSFKKTKISAFEAQLFNSMVSGLEKICRWEINLNDGRENVDYDIQNVIDGIGELKQAEAPCFCFQFPTE